jgi:hypothetical protein
MLLGNRNQVVRLFCHTNNSGFLPFPYESGECDTSSFSNMYTYCRATPSTVGNQEEQQIQAIRNREKVKNRS